MTRRASPRTGLPSRAWFRRKIAQLARLLNRQPTARLQQFAVELARDAHGAADGTIVAAD
jgi:hypothetical protein